MLIVIMQFCPVSCYFVPLMPKHPSRYHVGKHSQSVLPFIYKRTSSTAETKGNHF
jgi:hypothetical protein